GTGGGAAGGGGTTGAGGKAGGAGGAAAGAGGVGAGGGGAAGAGGQTNTADGGAADSARGSGGAGVGGNTGAVGWGKEEDPSAHCTVTAQLPAYAALMADGKLPDPFKMLDGTRITNKSQWACRREELLKQLFNYVYGDKPIPAKGSVSGTVSASMISVKVTEGG